MTRAKMRKRRISRAGRKPAAGVTRYPGGQIRHADRKPVETQQEILATAMAQPHRRGADDPSSRLLGYSIGRLLIAGQISPVQHDAAEWYGRLWLSYHRLVTGIQPPRVSAHLQEFIASTSFRLSHVNDNTDWHAVDQVRARMEGLQRAFADRGQYVLANRLLPSVCVFDMAARGEYLVALREALNTVHRFMQMGLDSRPRA